MSDAADLVRQRPRNRRVNLADLLDDATTAAAEAAAADTDRERSERVAREQAERAESGVPLGHGLADAQL